MNVTAARKDRLDIRSRKLAGLCLVLEKMVAGSAGFEFVFIDSRQDHLQTISGWATRS